LVGWKAELMPYESQQKGRMEADGRNLETVIRTLHESFICNLNVTFSDDNRMDFMWERKSFSDMTHVALTRFASVFKMKGGG
jgi:hypothetical protein